ncbi:MarR family transcriptional regulator [Sneathiella marina]|uniref:MarR family transcriptional regulator n=1 Tax=Sneathiella marina TaxID=2950108 RepID=A0ABY4W1R0_9PROT|nr:MarR family transcriptional regulator [Sneathiella marina]USG61095.1 MarR family transcriptional regulator [Sneathiella marina]
MYPTKEETRLWVALNLSQKAIYRVIDTALKQEGLPNLRWYDVLWELERAQELGVRPFELERILIFEQSNLSRLLRRMVGEGVVEEFAFESDGRGKVLKITQKGLRVRQQMWKIYGPLIHQEIGQLSAQHNPGTLASALISLIK